MSNRTQRLAIVIGLAALVGAIVAVVALRASDGSKEATKADYQANVILVRDRIDYAYARVGKATSVEELADRLDETAAVVGKSSEELDSGGVAAGFETLNADLVDALDRWSVSLGNTADQISDPNFSEGLPAINSIGFPEWDEVNATLSEMNKKGLKVELLKRH